MSLSVCPTRQRTAISSSLCELARQKGREIDHKNGRVQAFSEYRSKARVALVPSVSLSHNHVSILWDVKRLSGAVH